MKFNTLVQSILEDSTQTNTKKEKWVLVFKFTDNNKKSEYYLKPISELKGRKKEEYLKIAKPEYYSYGTQWEVQYKVRKFYYSGSIYGGNNIHLFVGKKENLEKVKDVFIKHNSKNTKFTQNLADTLEPDTREAWQEIVDDL